MYTVQYVHCTHRRRMIVVWGALALQIPRILRRMEIFSPLKQTKNLILAF